jgi:hypothetical protein
MLLSGINNGKIIKAGFVRADGMALKRAPRTARDMPVDVSPCGHHSLKLPIQSVSGSRYCLRFLYKTEWSSVPIKQYHIRAASKNSTIISCNRLKRVRKAFGRAAVVSGLQRKKAR